MSDVQGAGAPNHPTPSTVSGFACEDPWCADAARACDDLMRSGCGGDLFDYEDKIHPPNVGQEDDAFRAAVTACSLALVTELWETVGEKTEEKHPELSGKALKQLVKLNTGKTIAMSTHCTRNARNCSQMRECLRGSYIPRPAADWVTIPEPTPTPPPAPKPPYWQAPYKGESLDPLLAKHPWKQPVELMPVDSRSCAACALDRCPTFAFLCFSASETEHCKDGDCCHSFRRCVSACGGYEPRSSPLEIEQCRRRCADGRPRALQQLANLQHCAEVACKGCEKLDVSQGDVAP